jgi:hypothetical protein
MKGGNAHECKKRTSLFDPIYIMRAIIVVEPSGVFYIDTFQQRNFMCPVVSKSVYHHCQLLPPNSNICGQGSLP